MNKLIHPSFSLCGIKYNADISVFKRELMSLYTDDETLQYVIDICDFISQWIDDTGTILCHSSGSTGTPKEIHLEKTVMINSAIKTGEFFNLDEDCRALLCLPIQYIAGRMMLIRAMTLGWTLDIKVPHSDVLSGISKEYDFVAVVPLQFYKAAENLNNFKQILVGGGAISTAFIDSLKEKNITSAVYISYGMTETASHVAIRELYPHYYDCYKAVNGVSFSTTNEDCLIINAPDLNPTPLTTNDIVRLIDHKTFEWIGRRDYVINSGGIKIHPEESERILSRIITSRYLICGIKDDTLGERQILIIEGHKNDYPSLDEFIEQNFDSIHRPKNIYYVEHFPLTHTGKINRPQLLKMIK